MAKELIEPTKGGELTEYVDFGDDAGRGLEGATRNELLTPFVAVVHYSCPQITEGDEKYIDGARPGMLFNTVTKQLSNGREGVQVVPVMREHLYTEWRENRGGFVGTHSVDDPLVMRLVEEQGKFKKLITEDGNELMEQFNLYVEYAPDGQPITVENCQEAVIAFTSSKIQGYKAMFTTVNGIRYPSSKGLVSPPLWAHRWLLRSVPKKNDQGPFFVFDMSLVDPRPTMMQPMNSLLRMNDQLYKRAREFYEMLTSGSRVADYATANDATSLEDEIPF